METKETKTETGRGGKDLEVTGINDTKGSGGVVNTCKWFPLRNKGTGEGKANAKYNQKQK